MMCTEGEAGRGSGAPKTADPAFSAMLEDSAEDLYENAPCGYVSTLMDGTIAKINTTLLNWLGRERADLVGRRHFGDLLTVGGRIYYDTHIAPMLAMHGQANGLALDLRCADGTTLPVLVSSVVRSGSDGTAQLIRTTIFDARERRAYERELLRARRAAEAERERAYKLAATLQRSLLPSELPVVPGMQVAAYYHPASLDEVGGDFYDLFPLGAGRWGFFLGDISGKGAAAAALTSLTRYTLRATAVHDPDPLAVLTHLNAVLYREFDSRTPRFCTVVYGTVRPDRGGATVGLAAGGHPPPVLIRATGATELIETPGGMLVGALSDAVFTGRELRLEPGDTLLLYTDGLTESRTRGRNRFSEEQLSALVASFGPVTAPELVTALTGMLTGFEGVDDDTALLALGVPAVGAREPGEPHCSRPDSE
ncbi:SpoIIE family protein phosphatase [Nocardia aurantia]|uniref:PPM-type phosphatase domain-containing protein n=1 Tax=Nocardia aurantia TaxID=2585199 RepID=A0A7K0DZR3_9NOCA|nr:SpoIIE family protein phosphatase [Nocardia aurantia]MQY31215.1 hypothetical protein [Nocardia aurantia]